MTASVPVKIINRDDINESLDLDSVVTADVKYLAIAPCVSYEEDDEFHESFTEQVNGNDLTDDELDAVFWSLYGYEVDAQGHTECTLLADFGHQDDAINAGLAATLDGTFPNVERVTVDRLDGTRETVASA